MEPAPLPQVGQGVSFIGEAAMTFL